MSQIDEGSNNIIDCIRQYHEARGRLLIKLIKRNIYDIAQTLSKLDIA